MSRFSCIGWMTVLVACSQTSPGTSVRVALHYQDTLGLDTVEVTLDDRSESVPIAHDLLLLLPDELAGTEQPVLVSGRQATQPVAYGETSVTPRLGALIDASVTLAACTPGCQANQLTTCVSPQVACLLG